MLPVTIVTGLADFPTIKLGFNGFYDSHHSYFMPKQQMKIRLMNVTFKKLQHDQTHCLQ